MSQAESVATSMPLASLTTLHVGGPAEVWLADSSADLAEATAAPFLVLGAGSNLLVADRGVGRRVIRLGPRYNDLDDFRVDPKGWLGAATPLPGLVRRAQRFGLSGLEGLLGIPAVLGGAIAMNAGTRFGSIAEVVDEVELFVDGELVRVSMADLRPGYRRTRLPADAIIVRARLRLGDSTPERVAEAMQSVDTARDGQPKIKSAGCAFKNPPGDSAGRIIDEAGLRGMRVGNAMVSHEHGNFIVNLGQAKAGDVMTLVAIIRERVPVSLELEWHLWGF